MSSAESDRFNMAGALRAERAIVELRRGRAVDVFDERGGSTFAAIERIDTEEVGGFADAAGVLRLVVTPQRGEALGLAGHAGGLEIAVPADTPLDRLLALASGARPARGPVPEPGQVTSADPVAVAALELARHARLLPALLRHSGRGEAGGADRLRVRTEDVAGFPRARGHGLRPVSRARVPLAATEDCEFIVYRERFSDAEHVAIVIGAPDNRAPVPVRLHSACLTGDLLASLRCDCGDQLRGAVARIVEAGGGVVLYLAQEGRGIGLANKLRAYALQEQGMDTLQADRHLGFRADERDYAVACAMLKDLGIDRVLLLTNNPGKIAALGACEIEVAGRMPLPAPVNAHNAHYMRTKREQAGHLASGPEAVEDR